MAQELWLSNKQLSQLKHLETEFYASSGMEDAMSAGVMRGRPYGGVSISWSRDLNHVITPLTEYNHRRLVAVQLTTKTKSVIFMSIYMPFFDMRKREICRAETIDTISTIERIICDHPNHLFVIGGDFNCEFTGDSPFDEYWDNFRANNRFAHCSNLFTAPGYAYHHESLGQKKLNDHFLVSKEILEESICTNHKIIEDGHNPSDHLPILMSMKLEVQSAKFETNPTVSEPKLRWSKLTQSDLSRYHDCLASQQFSQPMYSCNVLHCSKPECMSNIQAEYDFIVESVKCADAILPRHQGKGHEKSWWTRELSLLKNQSMEVQRLWEANGRPGDGAIHHERLRVRANYRRALKSAQKVPKQQSWNQLHDALETCDTNRFWRSWKNLYQKKNDGFAPVVNGCTSKDAIAESFKKAFQRNCEPNSPSRVADLNAQLQEKYHNFSNCHLDACDCQAYEISVANVIDAISGLKLGKCADADDLSAEHFLNAPFSIIQRLTNLFNCMLIHSFVPSQFRLGFMIPIIKDSRGNHSDVGNYRGITISPIISKIFEHVLKSVFSEHLKTSTYQFGFKRKKSTSHALFCLKQTISYYIENDSRVFCSFLDASKAFDRLVHSGLFIKLIDRGIPKIFLDIIITWHNGLFCRVRWNGVYSEWFNVTAGVRQGGVLSPDFYGIYVDELISILKKAGLGCYVSGIFAASLFYADDMAVLAPSVKGLQRMLNLCSSYCDKWDILLNPKKTKNLFFGKGKMPSHSVCINNTPIPWVESWDYLGVTVKSGDRFSCCIKDKLCSFYRALNTIIRTDGRPDELVLLRLLEAHCLPILTYGIEIIHVINRDDRRQLRVAYNSIFRCLFHYSYNKSVTALQHALNRPTWEELLEKRQYKFQMKCLLCTDDPLIYTLSLL